MGPSEKNCGTPAVDQPAARGFVGNSLVGKFLREVSCCDSHRYLSGLTKHLKIHNFCYSEHSWATPAPTSPISADLAAGQKPGHRVPDPGSRQIGKCDSANGRCFGAFRMGLW